MGSTKGFIDAVLADVTKALVDGSADLDAGRVLECEAGRLAVGLGSGAWGVRVLDLSDRFDVLASEFRGLSLESCDLVARVVEVARLPASAARESLFLPLLPLCVALAVRCVAWRVRVGAFKADCQTVVGEFAGALPGKGFLEVHSLPVSGRVWIDGEDTGRNTTATWELVPGKYLVQVMREGYSPEAGVLEEVRAGKRKLVTKLLTKLEVLVVPPVVAKMTAQRAFDLMVEFHSVTLVGNPLGWLGSWLDKGVIDAFMRERGTSWVEVNGALGGNVADAAALAIMIPGPKLGVAPMNKLWYSGNSAKVMRLIEEDPKGMAAWFKQLGSRGRDIVATLAQERPLTSLGFQAMYRESLLLQTGRLAVWSKHAVGAAKALAGFLGFLVFSGFIAEEAIQTAGLPVFSLMKAGSWAEARKANDNYKATLDSLEFIFAAVGGVPLVGVAFRAFYDAALEQQGSNAVLIESSIPVTAEVTVDSFPPGARIVINGAVSGHTTPYTLELSSSDSFEIYVLLEGYAQPDAWVETFKVGEKYRKAFALVKGVPNVGRLTVRANVESAVVYVNGRIAGLVTYVQELPPGTYEVVVRKMGFSAWTRVVNLSKDDRVELDAVLGSAEVPEGEEAFGWLAVSVSPWSAVLRVDGVAQRVLGTQVLRVLPGGHEVEVTAAGFVSESAVVNVLRGRTSEASFVLDKEVVLEPVPVPGLPGVKRYRVDVAGTPTGAKILVNGSFTDKYLPDYVVLNAGTFEFSVAKTGFVTEFLSVVVGD